MTSGPMTLQLVASVVVPGDGPEFYDAISDLTAALAAAGETETPTPIMACCKCGAVMDEIRTTTSGVCPTHGVQPVSESPPEGTKP